jgi:hypothetical protein
MAKDTKLQDICSPEAYERLKRWINDRYPGQPYLPAPETYFSQNTKHREYKSRWLEGVITKILNHTPQAMAKKVETVGAKVKNKYGKDVYVKKRAAKRGEPDVQSTIQSRTVYFEVKIGRDQLSDEQKQFHDRARQAGCLVFTIRTVDEFFLIYDNLILKAQ